MACSTCAVSSSLLVRTTRFAYTCWLMAPDGALGSWGSAMIEPYADKSSSSGTLLVNASTLTTLTKQWSNAGYQVNIHAIGDLANRLAVDAFEAALKECCPTGTRSLRECQQKHRFRIEHSQIIHLDDQRRMKELGIIPSIQPTHATSDMVSGTFPSIIPLD